MPTTRGRPTAVNPRLPDRRPVTDRPSRSAPSYYLSHHKCATMYANSILGRVCSELGLRKRTGYAPEDFGGDLAFAGQRQPDLVCYLDAEWEAVSDLEGLRGVHVVRDPRDILVSAYFSHLHSHQTESWPELREHRERLGEVSKEEGLYLEMEFTGYVFEAMQRWEYDRDGVLEAKFEELSERPFEFWLRVMNHLNLLDDGDFGLRRSLRYDVKGLLNRAGRRLGWWPRCLSADRIPAQRLLGIVYDNRFEKKAGGRASGEADPESHYRKGEPGDWKNHLTDDHLEEFDRRFPRLLEKTGYGGDDASAGPPA